MPTLSDKLYRLARKQFLVDYPDIDAYWQRDWFRYLSASGYRLGARRYADELGWQAFRFECRSKTSNSMSDRGILYAATREAAEQFICAGLHEVT